MAACSSKFLLRMKRVAAFIAGGVLITLAVLSIVGCFLSLLFLTPVGWIVIVNALWSFLFGVLMVILQIGWGKGLITSYAGFLNSKTGRGLFYLFCGSMGGVAATKDASFLLVLFAYINWGMCWFVGIFELCGPRDTQDGSPAELRAGMPPELSVNINAAQASSAASWAMNNSNTVVAIAGAAASASRGNEAQSDNPFLSQPHRPKQ
eukprot:CAMPEP_0183331482 /NCGR_PEP_ID=MMETSP0164_2-20130417/854_1 /TAXON_ID=221442 /ORGANISM="Coccolithus pelagicus ssp braarudi, Strain PLY182g" /LENGTH=206 /DNA_ID=CAMNT_0025499973 /DNA_START=28 /DNA_END=648 /DNA_ORIENTATION=-